MAKTIRIKNVEIGSGRPKICALIAGKTAEEILGTAEKAGSAGCDIAEFRADYFEDVLKADKLKSLMRKLRKAVSKPLIFTLRTAKEGGKTDPGSSYYREAIKMVSELKLADIVDVERSFVSENPGFVQELRENGTYVILSVHDFNATPPEEEVVKTMSDMEHLGADIIKVAYMPNSRRDVLNLISASEEVSSKYAGCPVVAISMGYLGMVTRVLCEFMGSAITYASITNSTAPGQMNIEKLSVLLDSVHESYRRVIIAGFMGTGKTTVANALAYRYGLSKVDLDSYIEQREDMTISDIFMYSGEQAFREKETKYLKKIIEKDYQVIALGGGTVMKKENADLIRKKGIIVLLTASAETISERLKNDRSRPLLAENMDLDYIQSLMQKREEAYLSAADMVICTDNKTVDEICREIIEKIGFTF